MMMNKWTAIIAGLTLASCTIYTTPAQSENYIKFGYKVEDSNTKSFNGHQKWAWEPEGKDFQLETETNIYKTAVNGEDLTDRADGEYEFILNFTDRHYGIANFGFNYNANRFIGEFRPHTGIGWGWKFFRNDKWKMSHEFTVTQMGTEDYSELVWRNSTWIRYKFVDSPISITNKHLRENGDYHELSKNQFSIDYRVSKNIMFSLNDLYISDDAEEEYSVTYMSLGYTF
jgi:hypothetical protein